MKKYINEIAILLIQLFTFYVLPIFKEIGAIGMVLTIILATFILSIIIGIKEKEKIKYLYPIIVSLLFIPTVYIYYNESALIHSIWYFVVSFIGIILGTLLRKK